MGKGLLLEKKVDTEQPLKYLAVRAPDANPSTLDPHLCNAGNAPDSFQKGKHIPVCRALTTSRTGFK